jgi:hypothetical protein
LEKIFQEGDRRGIFKVAKRATSLFGSKRDVTLY